MTVKSFLSKLDALGRAWFNYLFTMYIQWNDFDEEAALTAVINRFKEHYEEINGKWKIRVGHRYDMTHYEWVVDPSPKALMPLALSEPVMYFNAEEIYAHVPLLLGAETEETTSVWHPLVMAGKWHHGSYGTVDITKADIKQCADNFQNQIIGGPIPVDELEGHRKSTEGAYGWVTEVQATDNALYGKIEWTPVGQKAVVEDRLYKYVSPRLFDATRPYTRSVNGEQVPNVVTAVALTNHPTFVGQPDVSVALTEYSNDALLLSNNPDEVISMPETPDTVITPEVPVVDTVTTPPETVETVPTGIPVEPVALSATVDNSNEDRIAALEAQLAALRNQQSLDLCLAQLDGLEFSMPAAVADESGAVSVQSVSTRIAPADRRVIANAIVALQSINSPAALELSNLFTQQGGIHFVPLGEQGLGLSDDTGPMDDASWLKSRNYASDTVTKINEFAQKNNVSVREAHDAVLGQRVR